MANKVVKVSDYFRTESGFAHDVVRRTEKEEAALVRKIEADKKKVIPKFAKQK